MHRLPVLCALLLSASAASASDSIMKISAKLGISFGGDEIRKKHPAVLILTGSNLARPGDVRGSLLRRLQPNSVRLNVKTKK